MELVLNWEYTGLNTVPSSKWTMAEKGAKCVKCAGADDKQLSTSGTANNFCLFK